MWAEQQPLARLGANVTGVDMLAENISVAQSRAQAEYEASKGALTFYERIRYYNCSVEDLAAVAENESYFDAVVMSEVIEHVSHPDTFLANSSKLLKVHIICIFHFWLESFFIILSYAFVCLHLCVRE